MKTSIAPGDWIIPLVIGVGAVAYLTGIFLPGQRALGRLREDLASKEALVAQTGDLSPAVIAAHDELENTLGYNRTWSEAAPAPHDVSDLFGRITAAAKDAGLKTTRFDPEPIETLERICRIPVSLGCEGTFSQVCQFLHSLEVFPQTVWINSLQMEANAKDEGSVRFEAALEIFADNPNTSDQVSRAD